MRFRTSGHSKCGASQSARWPCPRTAARRSSPRSRSRSRLSRALPDDADPWRSVPMRSLSVLPSLLTRIQKAGEAMTGKPVSPASRSHCWRLFSPRPASHQPQLPVFTIDHGHRHDECVREAWQFGGPESDGGGLSRHRQAVSRRRVEAVLIRNRADRHPLFLTPAGARRKLDEMQRDVQAIVRLLRAGIASACSPWRLRLSVSPMG